jgi:hypothetical protein
MPYLLTLVIFLIVGPAWAVTYRFDPLIHSNLVDERLRESQIFTRDGSLFGDVVIKNDSDDIAWLASAPSILVLGLNQEIGVDGPGAVGRVFGMTDRTGFLKLIEFGSQGLVVSEAGFINASGSWRCPQVTPTNRVCHEPVRGPGTTSQRELERLLALADRGHTYEKFDGFEFVGRFIDREHILPTQINKFGQVVFIHPLGASPNTIFLATPLSTAAKEGPLVTRAMIQGPLILLLLASALRPIAAWRRKRRSQR